MAAADKPDGVSTWTGASPLRHDGLAGPVLVGGGRLSVHGNNDTVGAVAAVAKLATGLSLNHAAVLKAAGVIDAGVRDPTYELGAALAATLVK